MIGKETMLDSRKKIILEAVDSVGEVSLPDLHDLIGDKVGITKNRLSGHTGHLKTKGFIENGEIKGKVRLTELGERFIKDELAKASVKEYGDSVIIPDDDLEKEPGGIIKKYGDPITTQHPELSIGLPGQERKSIPELVAMDEIQAILASLETEQEKRRVFHWISAYFAEIF